MRFDRDFACSYSQAIRTCVTSPHCRSYIKDHRQILVVSRRKGKGRNVDIAKQPLFTSLHPPLDATHHAIYGQRFARAWHQPIAQNMRWERERERARRARGTPSRVGSRRKRAKGGEERNVNEGGRGSCACLGAKSWASRAQAWPRLTPRSSRSEVIFEHEPPSGSQPLSLARIGDADINRIINDRSRRDSTNARNSRH